MPLIGEITNRLYYKCPSCGMNVVSREEFQKVLPPQEWVVFERKLNEGARFASIEFLGHHCPLCHPNLKAMAFKGTVCEDGARKTIFVRSADQL